MVDGLGQIIHERTFFAVEIAEDSEPRLREVSVTLHTPGIRSVVAELAGEDAEAGESAVLEAAE